MSENVSPFVFAAIQAVQYGDEADQIAALHALSMLPQARVDWQAVTRAVPAIRAQSVLNALRQLIEHQRLPAEIVWPIIHALVIFPDQPSDLFPTIARATPNSQAFVQAILNDLAVQLCDGLGERVVRDFLILRSLPADLWTPSIPLYEKALAINKLADVWPTLLRLLFSDHQENRLSQKSSVLGHYFSQWFESTTTPADRQIAALGAMVFADTLDEPLILSILQGSDWYAINEAVRYLTNREMAPGLSPALLTALYELGLRPDMPATVAPGLRENVLRGLREHPRWVEQSKRNEEDVLRQPTPELRATALMLRFSDTHYQPGMELLQKALLYPDLLNLSRGTGEVLAEAVRRTTAKKYKPTYKLAVDYMDRLSLPALYAFGAGFPWGSLNEADFTLFWENYSRQFYRTQAFSYAIEPLARRLHHLPVAQQQVILRAINRSYSSFAPVILQTMLDQFRVEGLPPSAQQAILETVTGIINTDDFEPELRRSIWAILDPQ